jgi:cytoskeletal protein RodZ
MFYHELKRKREAAGLTLEQISARTKINRDILFNFENGDFSQLPYTYVRLFLRTYAQEIGEDPQKVLRDLEEYLGQASESTVPSIPSQDTREDKQTLGNNNKKITITPERSRNFISALIALIIIVFLIAVLKQIFVDESQTFSTKITSVSEGYATDTTTQKIVDTIVAAQINRQLSLVMLTRDSCWVKVTIDGKDSFEGTLPPRFKREIKANERFEIVVGRPGEINLILNERDLGPVGERTIPTRLIITKDGIVRRQAVTR